MCESLTLRDKVELRDWLSDMITIASGGMVKSPLRCSILMGELATIMGLQTISYERRHPAHMWGRTMVAYEMSREGYSRTEIGYQMMKDHSSVTHMINKMRDALSLPQAYADIIKIWNEFQKRIQDDIHN